MNKFIMCPIQAIPIEWSNKMVIYNYTSLFEGIPQIIPLDLYGVPSWDDGSLTKNMDIIFQDRLLNDEQSFNGLMQIMDSFSKGMDVFLLIDNHGYPNLENLNESLIKFIQLRYGFTPYQINELSDLDDISYYQSCSVPGIINLDEDLRRYKLNIQRAEMGPIIQSMQEKGIPINESTIIKVFGSNEL